MYALAREEFERVLTRSDLNELERLVAAVDPQPRRRWRCLSYCILDAVWSMGAPHDTVVVPLVHRVAHEHGDDNPLLPAGEPPPPDSMSLWPFLSRFSEKNPLTGYTNAQRTSPHGARKADVAQKHARVLLDHGIQTVHNIEPLMDNRRWFPHVNATLAQLPGDGRHGTRRSYLWMLAGENDRVRPDHLVLRWFTRYGLNLSPTSAHSSCTSWRRVGPKPASPPPSGKSTTPSGPPNARPRPPPTRPPQPVHKPLPPASYNTASTNPVPPQASPPEHPFTTLRWSISGHTSGPSWWSCSARP